MFQIKERQNAQPGQMVEVLPPSWRHNRTSPIARVTKAQIILENGEKFWKKNGHMVGSSSDKRIATMRLV